MSLTLDPTNVAHCLAAFIERDRLRGELAQAQARVKALEAEALPPVEEPPA